MTANTLFLRLEGPLQAWGDNQSKFVVRRTADAPTKSGVVGLLCAALGVSRDDAPKERLPQLNALAMGVRIDALGVRWWDYHTIGAEMDMPTADGKTIRGAMLTRREYLCDASFLVALQGEPELIAQLEAALRAPVWPPYLGRKSCPPSRPILLPNKPDRESGSIGQFPDLLSALKSVPWQPRLKGDRPPESFNFLLEWRSTPEEPEAPEAAEVWYDVAYSLNPPAHQPRLVERLELSACDSGVNTEDVTPYVSPTPRPPRPRAGYEKAEWKSRALIDDPDGHTDEKGAVRKVPKGMRPRRLQKDHGLCVFCKSPANTVQHVTYRNAGGHEKLDDLRSLCRLCHDACTMLEYGAGMGMDRINPEDPVWRERIIEKRKAIIKFRSLATRRRKLQPEDVE